MDSTAVTFIYKFVIARTRFADVYYHALVNYRYDKHNTNLLHAENTPNTQPETRENN